MLKLKASLQAWNSHSFNSVFSTEVCALPVDTLPLQQALTTGSYASNDNLSITIINVENLEHSIRVKAGLFYSGIIAGCNCADDPSPVEEMPEYCEVLFTIDKQTAETAIELVNQTL